MNFGVYYRRDQSHQLIPSLISMMGLNILNFVGLVVFYVVKQILPIFLSPLTLMVWLCSILLKPVYGQSIWSSTNCHQLQGYHFNLNIRSTVTPAFVPRYSVKNVLLCGIWYCEDKPSMHTYLRPLVDALNQLYRAGAHLMLLTRVLLLKTCDKSILL